MKFTPEYVDNYGFLFILRDTLTNTVKPLPILHTLDYGAGALPHYSFFVALHPREKITAFDPHVKWIDSEPKEDFDLVVCHFSIHHMNRVPEEIIEYLRRYNPKFVAVAEYDYTLAPEAEFTRTFIAKQEKAELKERFNDNISACYEFHSKYSQRDYQAAMQNQGLDIIAEGSGFGVAIHKFFIIGQWKSPLQTQTLDSIS